MNVIRSLMLQLKGGTNWFDDPGMYFDPTNTTSGSDNLKQMSLANIKGNTTDSQTVLIAVSEDNAGSGHAVASGTAYINAAITTGYADAYDRRGLPIYIVNGSPADSFWDEGGALNVCRIDVIDMVTDTEFEDGSGNIIFALFQEGTVGEGTDVRFKFYSDDSSPTPYTFDGTEGVTSVKFVFPLRRVMSEVQEYEWTRTDFVSSWEGDVELMEDISNLWLFTGAGDNIATPTWTNTTNNYPLNGHSSDDLEAAINQLNDVIDDMTFTEDNYIADDDTVADALDKLDQALKDVSDAVTAGVGEKYVESISAGFNANTVHDLPTGIIYTPDATAGREGSNMDVFVDGQLLAADTGAAGANADRDYGETTTSGITFRFDIQAGRNITYIVRQ